MGLDKIVGRLGRGVVWVRIGRGGLWGKNRPGWFSGTMMGLGGLPGEDRPWWPPELEQAGKVVFSNPGDAR